MIIERGEVVGDPFYLFGRAGVGCEKILGGDMQIFTDIEEHI